MAVGTVRVERQSKGLYEQVRRVPGNRGAGGRVTTPSPAPGWYPDPSDAGKRIYWDGSAWSGPVLPAGQRRIRADRSTRFQQRQKYGGCDRRLCACRHRACDVDAISQPHNRLRGRVL